MSADRNLKANDWPEDYDVTADPVFDTTIKPFIEGQLAALEQLDRERAEWVKRNLPGEYEITYIFHEHTYRVAEDARQTAAVMGLPENVQQNLYWAALAHDCGKTQLPADLWDMVEKPENEIKAARRKHTVLGAELIQDKLGNTDHPFISLMHDIALQHHEQMDGGGPLGLKGDDLSMPVRLVAIVESFDGYSIPRPHFGDRDVSVNGVLTRMRDEKGAELYDMDLFESFAKMKQAQDMG